MLFIKGPENKNAGRKMRINDILLKNMTPKSANVYGLEKEVSRGMLPSPICSLHLSLDISSRSFIYAPSYGAQVVSVCVNRVESHCLMQNKEMQPTLQLKRGIR